MHRRQPTDAGAPADVLEGADLGPSPAGQPATDQDRIHDRIHERRPDPRVSAPDDECSGHDRAEHGRSRDEHGDLRMDLPSVSAMLPAFVRLG